MSTNQPAPQPAAQFLFLQPSMVFQHIEKLKQEYTDKLVVVDASRPELARFRDATGRVKTVNMNGRALVEFDQYANTGWYDIELDFLKIVDQPLPKPEKKEAAKPAAAKPAAGAAKPAAAAGAKAAARPSTADILAAARAKAAATAGTAQPASEGKAKTATPAVSASAAAAKPAGKMSTADILAAARAKKAAGATAAPAVETAVSVVESPATDEAATDEAMADEAVAEEEVVVEAAPARGAKSAASGPKPTTTAEKIAWCRTHDAQG